MLKALEYLRQLQALDDQIDAERGRVATIDVTLHDRSEFEDAKQRHQNAAVPVKAFEAEQRDLELKIGSARTHLSEGEQKLYSGKVSNPRELSDLQSRSADLRKQIATGEDAELKTMEQLEAARAELSTAEAELRRVVGARRALEGELVAERKNLVASVRAVTAARDSLRAQVDPASLKTYDRLRVRHGGSAVAEVKQRICLGCRVSLIGALEQRLRQGDQLITCQSCGRFLYILT